MSSNFLERFRNRIQKVNKKGELIVKQDSLVHPYFNNKQIHKGLFYLDSTITRENNFNQKTRGFPSANNINKKRFETPKVFRHLSKQNTCVNDNQEAKLNKTTSKCRSNAVSPIRVVSNDIYDLNFPCPEMFKRCKKVYSKFISNKIINKFI